MKESTAWRRIAKRIDEKGVRFGLCYEVMTVGDSLLYDTMEDRIRLHMQTFRELGNPAVLVNRATPRTCFTCPETSSSYFDDRGVAESRILAALFLALEAEDEGN